MTISYMRIASTSHPATFLRLLFLWRGSVWKSIHPELFIWLACYMGVSCTYRFVLRGTTGGEIFEKVVVNMDEYLTQVSSSLNFVLGFYVTYVATRWWWVFTQIPWPDNFFGILSAFFYSKGEEHRKLELNLRLSVNRYWTAAFIMALRDISECTRKRFPTLEHLVPSVLTKDEVEIIEKVGHSDPSLQSTCLYWIPLDWIMKLLKKAEQRGNLSPLSYTTLCQELLKTRTFLNNLLSQDFLSAMPLSYTQVSSFAPIIYFAMSLIGRQYVRGAGSKTPGVDYYFPFYTVYEFVIYFGWLKVAQVMLNPFGLDDDDYEIDWLVQRNYEYGRVILDRIYERTPPLADVELSILPPSKATAKVMRRQNPMIGSMAKQKLQPEETKIVEIIPGLPKFEPKMPNFLAKHPPAQLSPLLASNVAQTQEFVGNLARKPDEVTVEFITRSQGAAGDPKTKSFHNKTIGETVVAKVSTDPKLVSEMKTQQPQEATRVLPSTPAVKTEPTQRESLREDGVL